MHEKKDTHLNNTLTLWIPRMFLSKGVGWTWSAKVVT